MERRKFIIGAGALATGSAAAMGTGAFSSAEASRTVDVDTAGDANAFLQIDALSSDNADRFVDMSGTGRESNVLTLTIDDTAEGGSGVNEQAEMFFDDLFKISNQGTNSIWVWMKSGGSGVGFYNSDDSTDRTSISTDTNNIQPRPTIQYLEVGEEFNVGLSINTVGRPGDRDQMATVIAEANESNVPDNNGLSVENSDNGV